MMQRFISKFNFITFLAGFIVAGFFCLVYTHSVNEAVGNANIADVKSANILVATPEQVDVKTAQLQNSNNGDFLVFIYLSLFLAWSLVFCGIAVFYRAYISPGWLFYYSFASSQLSMMVLAIIYQAINW